MSETRSGGIGGVVARILFFFVIALTLLVRKRERAPTDEPISATLTVPSLIGRGQALDRLGWWFVTAVVRTVTPYDPFFLPYEPSFVSPGYRFH